MKLCNVKRRRQRQKINRYGKKGQLLFATLLQNELSSDVARFTPCERNKTLQQIGLNVGGKNRKIANELVLHQCYLSTYLLPCYPRQ